MELPIVSNEIIKMMKERFDVPASYKDSLNILVWKAAQRQVVLDMNSLHKMQREGKAGAKQGFKIRSDD